MTPPDDGGNSSARDPDIKYALSYLQRVRDYAQEVHHATNRDSARRKQKAIGRIIDFILNEEFHGGFSSCPPET